MDEEDVGSLPAIAARPRAKRRTTVFSGSTGVPGNMRRASIQATRKPSNSSSTEKLATSSKAIRLWEKLRAHVVCFMAQRHVSFPETRLLSFHFGSDRDSSHFYIYCN